MAGPRYARVDGGSPMVSGGSAPGYQSMGSGSSYSGPSHQSMSGPSYPKDDCCNSNDCGNICAALCCICLVLAECDKNKNPQPRVN